MTEKYKGIAIEYDEAENKWVFELRGRERQADSLTLAKEAIDKPAPKRKTGKPFTRIKAYRKHYSDGWVSVEVTSVATPTHWRSGVYVWIMSGKDREKVSTDELFPCSPQTDAAVAKHKELQNRIDALRDEQDAIYNKLRPLTIEPETE